MRVKISYSSVGELSNATNFHTARSVSHTLLMHAWFSYATKFHTFSRKYEKYEIKSRTKISAITVMGSSDNKRGLMAFLVIFRFLAKRSSSILLTTLQKTV